MSSFLSSLVDAFSLQDAMSLFVDTEQKFTIVQERAWEHLTSFNKRYGLPREGWLEITRMFIRVVAPLAAIVFIQQVFPPLAAQIILPGVVLSIIFLLGFYGLPDEEPVIQVRRSRDMIEIPPEKFLIRESFSSMSSI